MCDCPASIACSARSSITTMARDASSAAISWRSPVRSIPSSTPLSVRSVGPFRRRSKRGNIRSEVHFTTHYKEGEMSATNVFKMGLLSMVAATGLFLASNGFAADAHTTSKFEGVKANSGTATHARSGNTDTLTWSDDFKIPETPAPHWQVVDTKGNVYLLNRLAIKGDKQNRTIALPAYINDVAKVQIWCAFAEVLLGEASYSKPIVTASGERAQSDSMAMSR